MEPQIKIGGKRISIVIPLSAIGLVIATIFGGKISRVADASESRELDLETILEMIEELTKRVDLVEEILRNINTFLHSFFYLSASLLVCLSFVGITLILKNIGGSQEFHNKYLVNVTAQYLVSIAIYYLVGFGFMYGKSDGWIGNRGQTNNLLTRLCNLYMEK